MLSQLEYMYIQGDALKFGYESYDVGTCVPAPSPQDGAGSTATHDPPVRRQSVLQDWHDLTLQLNTGSRSEGADREKKYWRTL